MKIVPATFRTQLGTMPGWAIQNSDGQYYIWGYFDRNKARYDASHIDVTETVGTWKPSTALCVVPDGELKKFQQHLRKAEFKRQFE